MGRVAVQTDRRDPRSNGERNEKRFYRAIERLRESMWQKGHAKLFALPVLFTTLYKVSSLPSYATYKDIANGSLFIKNNIMDNSLNTTNTTNARSAGIKNFLASTQGKVIALVLTGVILVGGAVGTALLINSNNNDTQNEEEQTAQNSEVTPTSVLEPTTITPTVATSTPTPQDTIKDPTPTLIKTPRVFQTRMPIQDIGSREILSDIYYNVSIVTDKSLSAEFKEGAYGGFGHAHIITDSETNHQLLLTSPYEDIPQEFDEYKKVFSNQFWGDVYVVKSAYTAEGTSADGYFYSNNVSLNQNCDGFTGGTGVHKAPCGNKTLKLNSEEDRWVSMQVKCGQTSKEGVEFCNKIVKGMQIEYVEE